MKQFALAFACIAAAACASSGPAGSTPDARALNIAEPQFRIVQMVGPADQQFPQGEMEVKYGVGVGNQSEEPIKLRRIQLETVGEGGPYVLKKETYYFSLEVPAKTTKETTFWAKAYGTGTAYSLDARAPVGVRCLAYFETSRGVFRKVIVQNFTQGGGS